MACEPSTLSDSAAEFETQSFKILLAMTAFSLANGATPASLVEATKCFTCLSKKQLLAMWAYSLCQS